MHCHSTDVRYTLTHPIKRLFITAALRNAEKVFYTTPDLGAPVKTIRPDAIFLPNPISTIEFNCTIPVSQNRVLLFASLNDHLKGTEKAVAAVEKIRTLPDFKDFSVTVLPHGRDYLKYKECQSLSFTTLKSRQEIVEFICSFDIIMGQFSFGSMGVSELECMSCGKPVLNYFIYEDFYPERPPLVYCKTIEDIFQNLLSLVQNKSKQQEIGKQAREWICKYHDHLKITTRLKEEYGHFPVNS